MSDLTPVAAKIGKFLRLLSSDQAGEVIAAASAITRTLQAEGLDWHAIAEAVDGAKKFSESDALEIYQRGFQKGRDASEAERGFHSVGEDDHPSWHEIARECAAHPEKLRENERDFVLDMQRWTVRYGEPTEKQAAWLRKIYCRVRK
jgi:hypothetical protein